MSEITLSPSLRKFLIEETNMNRQIAGEITSVTQFNVANNERRLAISNEDKNNAARNNNQRHKYRPMYMAYGLGMSRREIEAMSMTHETNIENFLRYLHSNNRTASSIRTSVVTYHRENNVDTTWSLSWPPYLLIARLIIVILTYFLIYSFKIIQCVTPYARASAAYFCKLSENKLKDGIHVRNCHQIVFELSMTGLMYFIYVLLLTAKIFLRFFLTPISN